MVKSITLRELKLTSTSKKGWVSFYLHYYLGLGADGKKKFKKETLNIYADPKDKATYLAAKKHCHAILNARQLEASGVETGIKPMSRQHEDFIQYAQAIAEKVPGFKSREQWIYAVKHLNRFSPNGVTFSEVTGKWLYDFQQFLLGYLSQSSARSYSTKIRQAINLAEKDGILRQNPCREVRQIKEKEGELKFLYLEELALLEKTPHQSEDKRLAFLFNCFCPIRSGDLVRLTESHIRPNRYGGYDVMFVQDKQERAEVTPLSEQAVHYLARARQQAAARLGRKLQYDEPIFEVGHKRWYGAMLKVWAARAFELYGHELPAQIQAHFAQAAKRLSPHWARHTGATLLLNAGVSLQVVGDLLGHKDRKTTARYAKVYDSAKYDATQKMPKL